VRQELARGNGLDAAGAAARSRWLDADNGQPEMAGSDPRRRTPGCRTAPIAALAAHKGNAA
jgi:hypothetical protein